jgi:hypothetical protein
MNNPFALIQETSTIKKNIQVIKNGYSGNSIWHMGEYALAIEKHFKESKNI